MCVCVCVEGEDGGWKEIDSRYPLSRAASLLWPHLPIKPQAPMKIMTKRATVHPQGVMGCLCATVT